MKKLLALLALFTLGIAGCSSPKKDNYGPGENENDPPAEESSMVVRGTIASLNLAADWSQGINVEYNEEKDQFELLNVELVTTDEFKFVELVGTKTTWLGYTSLKNDCKELFSEADNLSVKEDGKYNFTIKSGVVSASKDSGVLPPVDGEWSDAELALLETYAHGVELPYPYFKGDALLSYDEDYDVLALEVENPDATDVEDYLHTIEGAGFEGGYDEDYEAYIYEIDLLEEGEKRFVDLEIYYEVKAESGEEEELITSSLFTMYVYDPYLYEWDNETVESLLDLFLPEGHGVVIPSFDAEYYSVNLGYIYFGIFVIDGFEVAADVAETYAKALTDNHYTIAEELDEDGYFVALGPNNLVEIDFCYFAEYDAFEIYVVLSGEEEQPIEVDPELEAVMQDVCLIIFESAEYGDDYDYDEDYECFYTNFTMEAESLEAAVEEVAELLIDEYEYTVNLATEEITYSDGTSGYNIILEDENNVLIDIYDWEEDEEINVGIDVYFGDGSTGDQGNGEVIDNGDTMTAKIDFSTMSDQVAFSSQSVGAITFLASKGTGNNDPMFYANGSTLRFYYGNTMSFVVEEGYEIVEIEINVVLDSSNNKVLDLTSLSFFGAEAELNEDNSVATLTPDGTDALGFTVEGTRGHIRITEISVTYRAVE